MSEFAFFLFVLAVFAAVFGGVAFGEYLHRRRELSLWKKPNRFVVRQYAHDIGIGEWICVVYEVTGQTIKFRQQGDKEYTTVTGNWNVQPLVAGKSR
jgi:purine-cytosine permease-like protein